MVPAFCPQRNYQEVIKSSVGKYRDGEARLLYPVSTMTERDAYNWQEARGGKAPIRPVRPRIREVAEFAKALGFKRIGLAFCSGLADEAARAVAILERNGLEVASVMCKCVAVDKEVLGVPAEYKIGDPTKPEVGCSPITQALVLNAVDTGFNVIVGLCVGHDMLFTRNSKSPVTTLVVKDRFTGHNPVASLYTGYHRGLVAPAD